MIHARSRGGRIELLRNEPGVDRKRRWTIIVTWDSLDGSHRKVIKPKKKCYLKDFQAELPSGKDVWNVQWDAKGK